MNVNELIPPFTLDDVVGRDWYKEILKQCTPEPEVDQYLKLDSIWPVAICGQPGCGKRTLAVAFAGTAAAAGRRCFLLNGSDLPEDIPSIREEFRKLASSMNGTQTVVILEGCGREAVWEALARELENPESDLEQLLLVLVEDDEKYLSSPWSMQMLLLHVTPPDLMEREAFFQMDENSLMRRTDEKGEKRPAYSWMAEQTEGLTYRDLNQVIFLIRLQMKGRVMGEYGGDIYLAHEQGYRAGNLFFTEKMFLDAADRVRNYHTAIMPDTLQVLQAARMMPADKGPGSDRGRNPSSPEEELSEDELIMRDILGMLED